MRRLPAALAALALGAAPGCGGSFEAGAPDLDAGPPDDPLVFGDLPEPGSLDELQRTIISRRCSGQPGLCHNGQFEPNLSTAAETYNWLVNRPAIENDRRLRVRPGDPGASFLIDKLRGREVSTIMPLGAEPLAEEEIAAIETWIEDGALRRPEADPPVALDNPPRVPEIGVFDAGGVRLDRPGGFTVAPGTLTIRHSVSDFETPDSQIPFGVVLLQLADGRSLVLEPGAADPANGITSYDPDAPMGAGDLLNFRREVSIGAEVDLVDGAGNVTTVASAGLVFTAIVLYVDAFPGGMIAFAVSPSPMTVE